MSYVQGEDRGQAALLPAAIEDYVVADAPVRVIDAFVDGLDVRGLGFGRSIRQRPDDLPTIALERMNARFHADPTLIRQRRCASEHPFATIKRMTPGGRFLTRGLGKVSSEATLSVLAYNIIRVINLVGATTLRASLA